MTRAVLYARYSSDQQSPASIEDQLRICREQAARDGLRVVGVYRDAAVSGSSVTLRPGIQALLQDAQQQQFDVVLAEALDRVSRDQADVATLYKHLQFSGVRIVTLAEGEVSELHVGLKGTMNALFLKDLANKTRRGLRGRVEQGKSGGGLCYGYDVVRRLSSEGEPVRGERTINPAQAEVVQRLFKAFADGVSPQALALRLNTEGVPGPGGRLWTATTIRGHQKRGTGLINNELYIGRLIWNRQRYVKNPTTGKRVARLNPPEAWITTEVPELRIVDDALWQAAKARQGRIAEQHAGVIDAVRKASLNRTHRPKSLLSGLVRCGACSGLYTLRGQGRFACSNHVDTRTCANGRTITRAALEDRVLAGLKHRLMAPDLLAEAVRAYVEETNRLNHERRAAGASDRLQLQKVRKTIQGLVVLAEEGKGSRTLVERLVALEAEEDALVAKLAEAPADTPDVHPNIAELYRRKVARLAEALNDPADRDEAADALRALIDQVVLTPGDRRGEVHAVLHGEFGAILDWLEARNDDTPEAWASGVSVSVGAGARSGHHSIRSTIDIPA